MEDKIKNQIIKLMAKELKLLRQDVIMLQDRLEDFSDDLYGTQDYDLQVSDEELVRFTSEFYKEICKVCGTRAFDFMGIA